MTDLKKIIKRMIRAFLLVAVFVLIFFKYSAWAAQTTIRLDRAPDLSTDISSLQSGARLFVNYCLGCHAAVSMRYSHLRDIGLSDEHIQKNLLFTGEKVGDLMMTALSPENAKAWFGSVPPDLSVIARSAASSAGSGSDWLYTYLRTFYKDDERPTGWNNLLFPNVGMPHVLWELQGIQTARFEVDAAKKDDHAERKWINFQMLTPGTMTPVQYDTAVAQLVAYLNWMSEPVQNERKRLGVWVLLYLGLFFILAWRLNATYWKNIK